RCCSAQPPQRPKYSQPGETRSGAGSTIRTSSASWSLRRRLRSASSTVSPRSAFGTKTRRPSTSATPSPSCVRSTIRAVTRRPSHRMANGAPSFEKLAQVRPIRLLELRLDELRFVNVLFRVELASQDLEAQIDQIGVQRVRLAVVADRRELAALVARPDV